MGGLLVLVFLPLVGFILYLLLGRQIQREHIFKLAKEDKVGLEMIVDEQLEALKSKTFLRVIIKLLNLKKWYKYYFIIMLLTTDNDLTIYTDGHQKFDDLINDIRHAQSYIHIQYYIIHSDNLGKQLLHELEKKAEEGIEVKMLYDDMGSRDLRKKDLKSFVKRRSR